MTVTKRLGSVLRLAVGSRKKTRKTEKKPALEVWQDGAVIKRRVDISQLCHDHKRWKVVISAPRIRDVS